MGAVTRFASLATLVALSVFVSVEAQVADEFAWSELKPSKNLEWVPCYVGKDCARLSVPLDYSNPDGEKAAIAMVRLHSSVPHDSPEYRGPVLLNPGGPGGSGVDLALGRGGSIHSIIGPEFDVIGFDPRAGPTKCDTYK
ncbi:Abhydrolase-4 domain-containing protein [Mycena kentingensis (nom. inval.)]|nr:Abhydrolase-4 domain-containing protein [Mycena kentingensis (nom. inval.)]